MHKYKVYKTKNREDILVLVQMLMLMILAKSLVFFQFQTFPLS